MVAAGLSRQSSAALSDMDTDDVVPMDVDRRSRSRSRAKSPQRSPARARNTSPAPRQRAAPKQPTPVPFVNIDDGALIDEMQRRARRKREVSPAPARRAPSPPKRIERRPSRSHPRERSPPPARAAPAANKPTMVVQKFFIDGGAKLKRAGLGRFGLTLILVLAAWFFTTLVNQYLGSMYATGVNAVLVGGITTAAVRSR